MMGPKQNAIPPPADVVEVSEDSSIDDPDHYRICGRSNNSKSCTTISSMNKEISRKRRKTRRSSTSGLNHRGAREDRTISCGVQRSKSYPGEMQRTETFTCIQQSDDDWGHSNSGTSTTKEANAVARGGVSCPFPWKLHEMLDFCCPSTDGDDTPNLKNTSSPEAQLSTIVTWNPEGTAFAVLDAKLFVQTILPRYVGLFVLDECYQLSISISIATVCFD
jgi:hypothetical protein